MSYKGLNRPGLLVGFSVLIVLLFAVACGEDATPTSPPATATSLPPATPTAVVAGGPTTAPTAKPEPTATVMAMMEPKFGGVINMQAYAAPLLDIIFLSSLQGRMHSSPLFNNLVEFNPETPELEDVRGDLARDWTLGADGMTYTFNLREGVKFHDGVPMTAEDVVLSMNIAMDPDSVDIPVVKEATQGRKDTASALVGTYYESIRMIDPLTVEIKTKFPSPAFIPAFGSDTFKIIPKHLIDAGRIPGFLEPKNMIGTGPFMLKKYEKDVKSEDERNPNYFKENRPYLDGIVHFIILDHGTIIAAYKTGQVLMSSGMINNLSVAEALQLEKELGDKLNVHWGGPLFVTGVLLNARVAPFDNPKVRRALMLGLHRQPIMDIFTPGKQLIGTPIPSGYGWSFTLEEALNIPGFRELNGEKHPDDLAEAQKLAKEGGAPPGTKVTLMFRPVIEFVDLSVVVKEQLQNFFGWEVKLNQVDPAAGLEMYRDGDFQMSVMSNSFRFPDPDASAASYRAGGSYETQRTGWFNPDAEPLWDSINRETDPNKRKAFVGQANDVMLADNAWPYLYYQFRSYIVDKRVQGFNVPPHLSTYKKHEQLWCDPNC